MSEGNPLLYGETAARSVAAAVHAAADDTTAIEAIPAAARAHGMLVINIEDQNLWIYDATSTDSASSSVLEPDDAPTAGRWLLSPSTNGSSATSISGTTVPATPAIGQSLIAQSTSSTAWSYQPGTYHTVRGICTSNMSTSAFVGVTGGTAQDGITYAEGERVLLAGQTTAAQNGIYVVGAVDSGTAPLTRATDWFTGAVLPEGSAVFVSKGTLWANTLWNATVAGSVTVGTTAPAFYPKSYTIVTTAMSGTPGTKAVSSQWILSATLSNALVMAKAPGGTQGILSIGTLTAGAGSGSFTVTSTANETSTLQITIVN